MLNIAYFVIVVGGASAAMFYDAGGLDYFPAIANFFATLN